MKSSDLRALEKVGPDKQKRVLLINPKKDSAVFSNAHNGLALLATILKSRGHEVMVLDYLAIRKIENIKIPAFIEQFRPDAIGMACYTPLAPYIYELVAEIHAQNPMLPIILGGPHPTLYTEHVQKNSGADYILVGEAELTIIDTIENAKREEAPKIVHAQEIVNLDDLPLPDYTTFYMYKEIRGYSIMTSKGCPNKCNFCAVVTLDYGRWRLRKVEDCIKELEIAKKTISPHLHIGVIDDNPTVHKERFNEFLKQYVEKIKLPLFVTNTRADGITDEFIELLKKCGCSGIAIGVEHAHPEVFKLINKGETMETIERACRLIKKHKFGLILTFIIGLPGDNLERTKASIEFCKKVKADGVSLNMMVPYRGTTARDWFDKHGVIIQNEIGIDGQIKKRFECVAPVFETPDFSKTDKEKAYYMFLFGVAHHKLKLRQVLKIFKVAMDYGLYYEFFKWLPNGIKRSAEDKVILAKIAFNTYKKEGLRKLIERYKLRNRWV